MPVFLVCSEEDHPDLEKKVKEEFEDHFYVLRPDSQWLIDAEKTTEEVADKLEIKEGGFEGVVFLTTNNWGYHRSSLWEWMELDWVSERPATEEYSESPQRVGTPAETWPTREYNFGLQTIMEMQKTLGGLTEAVKGLKTSVEGQGKSIDRIKMAVYIATGAFIVIAPLVTYLLDKKFDAIIGLLSK